MVKLRNNLKKFVLITSILLAVFAWSTYSHAQETSSSTSADLTEYELLAPIPYVETTGGKTTAVEYIPGAVKLVIVLSGVLAVVMIMVGGIQYMSTEAVSGKGNAKKIIENAFWGLGLVLGAFVILNTINPNLLTLDITLERFAPPANPDLPEVSTTTPPFPPDDEGAGGGGGVITPPPIGERCFRTAGMYGPSDNTKQYYPACPTDTPLMVDLALPRPENFGINCKHGSPCKVALGADAAVRRLIQTARNEGVLGWRITDAYPPTSYHRSNCHFNGGCMDIAPSPDSNKTNDQYIKLCRALKAAGLTKIVNEASNNAAVQRECGTWQDYAHATGGHLHINFY